MAAPLKEIKSSNLLLSQLGRLRHRLVEDRLWNKLVGAGDAPRKGIRAGARMLRILVLAAASFSFNEVPVRAAALTFTTLLAFIPFAIILSSVAGLLGYLDLLTRLIPYLVASFEIHLPLDPLLRGIERAQGLGFKQLGLWGSLGLLFSFFLSMNNIGSAVDRIWNLRKKRSWLGKFRVYTPFLFLLMGLVILSTSILLLIRDKLHGWSFEGAVPAFLPRGTVFLFGALGVLIFLWVGLVLMIRILPNTKVRWGPAILGATVATTAIYFLSRLLYLFPKLLESNQNFLYGSLAIFPVLLFLIYALWIAALFGAAVAFIDQQLYRGQIAIESEPNQEAFQAVIMGTLRLWNTLIDLEKKEKRGDRPIAMQELAKVMEQPETKILEWSLLLQELRWVAQRKSGGQTFFRSTIPAQELDLIQLHRMLVRLDPEGTGIVKSSNSWLDVLHEVKSLYSRQKDLPGISLASLKKIDLL